MSEGNGSAATMESRLKDTVETLSQDRVGEIKIITREMAYAFLALRHRCPEADPASCMNAACASVLSLRKDKREGGRWNRS